MKLIKHPGLLFRFVGSVAELREFLRLYKEAHKA